MYEMHGLTNGIYWFDVKTVVISSTIQMCLQMGRVRAVKFGVSVDACLTIDGYCIGYGKQSDDELFKATEIGKALVNRKELGARAGAVLSGGSRRGVRCPQQGAC